MEYALTDTVLKSINTNKFDVALLQTEEGSYFIQSKVNGITEASEIVVDYGIADFMFEVTLSELEGQ